MIADDTTAGDRDYARAAKAVIDREDRVALSIAERIEGFVDRSLAHRFLFAFLCYRHERYEEAEILLEQVVADEPFVRRYPSALYYSGRAIMYGGDYRRGLTVLERFETLTNDDS